MRHDLSTLWARGIWAAMLWVMRRPPIRRLQRMSVQWLPEERQERAWQNLVKQERWARRYGLKLITFTLKLFLLSVALTVTFMAALQAHERGWLPFPTDRTTGQAASQSRTS